MPSTPSSAAPLLAASSLRIDVNGTPVLEGVTLTSTGEWVLLLGYAPPLVEAASGLRAVDRGQLLVGGLSPIDSIRTGVSAGAPLDPPLPPRWSVTEYVTWSARLSGQGRTAARATAAQALERLALSPYRLSRLGPATTAVRRGTVLAAALATGASIVLVEDPMAGLSDEVTPAFSGAIARALADRRVVYFAARLPFESPIALAADEAIVMDRSHVAAQGAPAEIAASQRAFALRVTGDIVGFARALSANGASILAAPSPGSPARCAHLSVHLGTLGTLDLLRIAEQSSAIVVELRPLASAFA